MTTNAATTRPREAEEFLTVLQDSAPGARTACPEWSVHDIAAHVAGACEEVIRHVTAYGRGRPLTRTRGFEEREAPFREMAPAVLQATVDRVEETMRREVATVLQQEPDAVLDWTGRRMRVASFLPHLRGECAIHRWDIVGEDEIGDALLGQYELLSHAVTAIGSGPLLARGLAAGAAQGAPFAARIRADGQPDLLARTADGAAELTLVDPEGKAAIDTDPAARLLTLWGRTPLPATRLRAEGRPADATRVRRLMAGY
jgi:hypothetical protein